MKKGVSLISLIITIIVIIILASISIFSSMNTVEQSQEVKNEAEFQNVSTMAKTISARVQAGLVNLNLTNASLATSSQINSFYTAGTDSEFTQTDKNNVLAMNNNITTNSGNPLFGYHYVTGVQIENDTIPGMVGVLSSGDNYTVPNKVKNNYLINFYYGTVITKVSDSKTSVSGKVVGAD